MIYDLIVIGGGPAGIFSGILAGENGLKVALIEKEKKIGKKLLIAGAGRCNLTHQGEISDFLKAYGKNGKKLREALYTFSPQDMLDFFKVRGLPLEAVEKTGKYFPKTNRSIDVVNLLKKELIKNKCELILEEEVVELVSEKDIYIVKTNKRELLCKKIIVATGGKSYPETGSDGKFYNVMKSLGIDLEPLKPALTPVHVRDYPYGDIMGVSFKDIEVVHKRKKVVGRYRGPLLLTHKNISGPVILDNSRYMEAEDVLEINFLNVEGEIFEREILKGVDEKGKKTIKGFLKEWDLPERFIEKNLKLLGVDSGKTLSTLKKAERVAVVEIFAKRKFVVSSLGGFNVAMVTKGGVGSSEINFKKMESKKYKGLYFAGEVVDVDGDTGGYNIQIAFSTGALAVKSILGK